MKPSQRSDIRSFMVMDVLDRANAYESQGRNIIHMEVGQPGTPAPEAVRRAAIRAIKNDPVGYTEAFGLPKLRERIALYYQENYGAHVPASRIVITAGSSAAFVLSFLAVFDVGARVALAAPYYPAYPNILKALSCEPLIIPTDSQTDYQLTVDQVADAFDRGATGLLLASPANPTGSMVTPDVLRAIVELCRERSVWLFSDEIYHGITYGKQAQTAAAYSDQAIVINSFSKYFSMTGWRIGWMVVPKGLLRSLERLNQNLYISTHAVSQLAALKAFDCRPELDANVAIYKKNRELLLEKLLGAGLTTMAPADGAFYLYADVSDLTNDSRAYSYRMLREIGVATTPGVDFDTGARACRIRFSYAGTHEDIVEGAERLKSWLAKG